MLGIALALNQINLITFVLVDATLTEVAGLGGVFTLQISKNGGGFVGSTGAKAEISNGWYSYELTAAECDTIGPLSIRAWGAGTIQQNLAYIIQQTNYGCIQYTYTVTDSVTLLPLAGVEVWFTTDVAGLNVVWHGFTDAFGVARDAFDNLPCLDAGTYYAWKNRVGYADDDNPDTEVVS